MVGYVEIISSSDKQSSRISKHRRTITTGTRSHASLGGTSQRLTKQVPTQESSNNTLTT